MRPVKVTVSTIVHAPPERIMHILTNVPDWPKTCPPITAVEAPPGPLRVGSRFRAFYTSRGAADSPKGSFEVEVLQLGPLEFCFATDGRTESTVARYSLEPKAENETLVTVETLLAAAGSVSGIAMRLMLPLIRSQHAMLLDLLKKAAEATT